ncbi:Carboxylesterase [Dictyocaulus viviparus]|uniref:Carboxylic ester hydrolase n=1 Tax=Dictyocaulus viviparus TaxID=29172 RepID=A0A0D8X8T2_DICVI|nr:Carboxylesterase [Dictyocaulus viviparus]
MDFHRYDKFSADNMKRQSEDCLYLNVFSPYDHEDESKTFPIIVWIHGGSFLAGSADTGIDMETIARNIIFKGITFVTINYRLGPLGFINMQDGEKVEGNYGIWDQVMALQWIQANIKQFGGDPSRVTLMGESAGGAACSLLAVSPISEGLAHQAIIMSGSSTAGWAIHRHGVPAWSVENLVRYLRCEKSIASEYLSEMIGDEFTLEEISQKKCNDQIELLQCLTDDQTPNQQMNCLRKHLNFSSAIFRKSLAIEIRVSKMIVDGELVPISGVELIQNYARLPIMTGIARKEWAHKKPQFYNLHRKSTLTAREAGESVFRIIEGSFHDTSAVKLSNSTLHLLANASFVRYVDDPSNSFETSRVVSALQTMEADIEFVAPCQREINAYVQNNVTVYAYSFDYFPKSPIFEEEKKTFALFGKQPVTILRKDQSLKVSQGSLPFFNLKPVFNFITLSFSMEKKCKDRCFDPQPLAIYRKLEAFHGLDHAFIFSRGYSSNFEIRPFTKEDENMAKILTNMITNFAKNGDPSTKRFTWPPFTRSKSTEHVSINLPPKIIKGELHWPHPKFWNVEAELISRHASEGNIILDPDADLTNEERVQLSAYRRAWWALWLLVAVLAIIIWGIVIYAVVSKGSKPRSKPYDNIVITR